MATTKHYNVYVRGEFVCDTWQKNKKEAIDVAYFHYGYGYEKKILQQSCQMTNNMGLTS